MSHSFIIKFYFEKYSDILEKNAFVSKFRKIKEYLLKDHVKTVLWLVYSANLGILCRLFIKLKIYHLQDSQIIILYYPILYFMIMLKYNTQFYKQNN